MSMTNVDDINGGETISSMASTFGTNTTIRQDDDVETTLRLKLNNLTSASTTLINELTKICKQNIDKSNLIVNLIEMRITKCFPKHKLYGFYLIDSIIKNVGNPYNLLFEPNLLKIFKDTYLLVPEIRQSLIDLFKTWMHNDIELFNKDLLTKIEEFIIKATKSRSPRLANANLSASGQPMAVGDSINNGDPGPGAGPGGAGNRNLPPPLKPDVIDKDYAKDLPINVTPEQFLRECNILLQYIISLNNRFNFNRNTKFYKKNIDIRNQLVSRINQIHESLIKDTRNNFKYKIQHYHKNLVHIRSILDNQSIRQNLYLQKKYRPNIVPNKSWLSVFNNPLQSVDDNDRLRNWLDDFGLPIKNEKVFIKGKSPSLTPPVTSNQPDKPQESEKTSTAVISTDNDDIGDNNGDKPSELSHEFEDNPLGLGFNFDFDPVIPLDNNIVTLDNVTNLTTLEQDFDETQEFDENFETRGLREINKDLKPKKSIIKRKLYHDNPKPNKKVRFVDS